MPDVEAGRAGAAEMGRAGAAVVLNAVGGVRGVTVAAGEVFVLGPLGPLITRSSRAVGRGIVDAVHSGLRCAQISLRTTTTTTTTTTRRDAERYIGGRQKQTYE